MVQQFVYDPPAGSPPFEFHINGGPKWVSPPDQFWKRATEQKRIGVKLDGMGNISKEVWRPLSMWVPDDDRNAAALSAGVKPDNTIWLTKGQAKVASSARYSPMNQYLKPIRELDQAHKKSMAQREAEHAVEIEKMRKLIDREKQQIQDQGSKEIQEMRASFRDTVKQVADKLGVDVKLLDELLSEARATSGQQSKGHGTREAKKVAASILDKAGA